MAAFLAHAGGILGAIIFVPFVVIGALWRWGSWSGKHQTDHENLAERLDKVEDTHNHCPKVESVTVAIRELKMELIQRIDDTEEKLLKTVSEKIDRGYGRVMEALVIHGDFSEEKKTELIGRLRNGQANVNRR